MPPHDLDPVTRLTADAIGEPGARTFLLQAASGLQQITLLVEKDQVRVLAERVIAWLPELAADRPEDPGEVRAAESADLSLNEPVEPDFRVGQLALTYDKDRDRVVVVATELVPDDDEAQTPTPRPLCGPPQNPASSHAATARRETNAAPPQGDPEKSQAIELLTEDE